MYCARTNEFGQVVIDNPQPVTLNACPLVLFTPADYPTAEDFNSATFAELFSFSFFLVLGSYLIALKVGVIRKVMS